jgi:hypothetical protein
MLAHLPTIGAWGIQDPRGLTLGACCYGRAFARATFSALNRPRRLECRRVRTISIAADGAETVLDHLVYTSNARFIGPHGVSCAQFDGVGARGVSLRFVGARDIDRHRDNGLAFASSVNFRLGGRTFVPFNELPPYPFVRLFVAGLSRQPSWAASRNVLWCRRGPSGLERSCTRTRVSKGRTHANRRLRRLFAQGAACGTANSPAAQKCNCTRPGGQAAHRKQHCGSSSSCSRQSRSWKPPTQPAPQRSCCYPEQRVRHQESPQF